MVQASAQELQRRLDAGESLTPGEVAQLLGRGYSRSTVSRMLTAGEIEFTRSRGGHRLISAEDVRKVLAQARTVHRGAASPATAEPRSESEPA